MRVCVGCGWSEIWLSIHFIDKWQPCPIFDAFDVDANKIRSSRLASTHKHRPIAHTLALAAVPNEWKKGKIIQFAIGLLLLDTFRRRSVSCENFQFASQAARADRIFSMDSIKMSSEDSRANQQKIWEKAMHSHVAKALIIFLPIFSSALSVIQVVHHEAYVHEWNGRSANERENKNSF